VNIAVLSSRQSTALTRATVRRAVEVDPSARVNVLDVDGSYPPVGGERVLIPEDVGLARAGLHRSAARLEPADLVRSLYPRLVRTILAEQTSESEQTVLVMRPGVLLISRPAAIIAGAVASGLCLLARAPLAFRADGRWPGAEDVARAGSYSPALLALHGPQDERDEYCQAIWLPRAIRGSVPPVSHRSPGAVHSRQDDGAAIERRGLKGSAFHRGGDLRDERPLARITHQDVHGHCAGGTWRNIDPH